MILQYHLFFNISLKCFKKGEILNFQIVEKYLILVILVISIDGINQTCWFILRKFRYPRIVILEQMSMTEL